MKFKVDKIAAKASSQTYNKAIKELSEITGIEVDTGIPSKRFAELCEKLKTQLENLYSSDETTTSVSSEAPSNSVDRTIDEIIESLYELGIHTGFSKALEVFMNGKITTKKIKNEQLWTLHSSSRQFQVTNQIKLYSGDTKSIKAIIALDEHGFNKD